MNNRFKNEYLAHASPRPESGWKAHAKRIMSNPLGQFGLLGLLLAITQLLNIAGIVPRSIMTTIAFVSIYSIAAIGFCLLLGYSGLASLGTAGFMGLGIYLCYYGLQEWQISILPAFLIAGIASIVIGFVVGFVSLRIEGIYLAIMTLALSEIIVKLLKTIKGSTLIIRGVNLNFFGIPLSNNAVYFTIIVVLVMLLVGTANLINSPTGRAMVAMKSSVAAAQAMGISLLKYRLLAFIISTLFAGIAGFFYHAYLPGISPTTATILTLSMSLNILGAVIIGGAKSLWGTLVGTFVIYGFQSIFLQNIAFFNENPAFMMMVTGVLIILVVMFYPGGFAQMLFTLRLWLKKMTKKWRIYRYGIEE
ncbi:MAG TPA: branched-chain amino acid ABC transporter permease [Bacilli bacterium]|jgi:branched-chain amino acid transport system permease protein|nr:branched-chain amino acid ABC transporter permease [Bacilli bacterium]